MSKSYDIMLTLIVDDGSFNAISDLMKYIEYRLNVRGRGTESVKISNICLLREHGVQLDFTNDGKALVADAVCQRQES